MTNQFPKALSFESVDKIKTYQEQQLQHLLSHLGENSKFYQDHFAKHKIDLKSINSIADLQSIPSISKHELQARNEDFICIPKKDYADIVTTSGTSGEPVTIVLSKQDLSRLAYNEAKSMSIAGINSQDLVQLMTTIDRRFMAGLAYFLGVQELGAGIIRVGGGLPQIQWETIAKYEPSTIIVVPSFILKLVDYAEKYGIDYQNSSVKQALCIGESIRDQSFNLNKLGKRINEKWPIALYTTYASTEMATAFTECSAQKGGHLIPELIIAEVLDDKDMPVAAGELGELTITTLHIEGTPLLRFRTGDVVAMHKEKCSCGRNTLRLGPVEGRRNQMIKYKGTTIYPPAIYNLLNGFEAVQDYYIEIYSNSNGSDEIKVNISTQSQYEQLEEEIIDMFRSVLRVKPIINIEDNQVLKKMKYQVNLRKPINFIDKRKTIS